MFSKILIANRGEIACRIIRTAKKLGIRTVAVYSEADAGALHVRHADQAVHIGGVQASDSYLQAERIITAALETGAQAIHPGFGFLSENPDFVEAVERAGLVFIGPSASAIRAMGLKDAAKKLMSDAGVPVVPGYHGDNQETGFLAGQADEIGYPVLIKARAGGGGKGMRKVNGAGEFSAALEGAVREAEASFGDGHVLIEKYVASPRHIEVQVFGDSHGNVVHLFERDCSLQRRHQKVIEEAPAPGMTDEMRRAITDAAVTAAKAIGYENAGTIEFIVDGSDGLHPDKFWFMEMNTRLQVEHPVTEEITGVDLVEWQLTVASGKPLPLQQGRIELIGHAFEARLYAEDVPAGFLPSIGTLHHLNFSDAARNETGVRSGDTITPYYDPMIAKVITHGSDRKIALSALHRALEDTEIAGTVTNIEFLKALCRHEGFAGGEVDTGLIERDIETLSLETGSDFTVRAMAALVGAGLTGLREPLAAFRLFGTAHTRTVLISDGELEEYLIASERVSTGLAHAVRCGDRSCNISDLTCDGSDRQFTARLDGNVVRFIAVPYPGHIAIISGGSTNVFGLADPLDSEKGAEVGSDQIVAPMPGLVKSVLVSKGSTVSIGDALVVLEAMKMEHTLKAGRDGLVETVQVSQGDQVEDGAVLIVLEQQDG